MQPLYLRNYVLAGVEHGAEIYKVLLEGYGDDHPIWDFRPDPERFTLREVLAHLTDWEPIFLSRMERMIAEEEPVLQDMDEGQMAIDRDYASQSPQANLARFQEARKPVFAFLKALPEAALERGATRPPVGRITLEDMGCLILAHDSYHLAQATDWLTRFAAH